jgi:hypothetical protein
MPDVIAPSFRNPVHHAEYGNAGASIRMRWRGAAMVNGDQILFGTLPAGATITDVMMVNTASSASTTMAIGFRNADGTTTSPDTGSATFQVPSNDYWVGATSIATAARTRAGAPGTAANGRGLALRLNKDVIIVGTLAGANIAIDTIIEVQVSYVMEGAK